MWEDLVDDMGGNKPRRARPGRWTRWEDPVKKTVAQERGGHWQDIAGDRGTWDELRDAFIIRETRQA